MTMTYKPGQDVWLVLTHRGEGRTAKVEKVGRKWATLDHGGYRVDMATGRLEAGNYSSPGCVFASREAYEANVAVRNAWNMLCDRLHNAYGSAPSGVTLPDIAKARELLGLGQ
jgi:hypothetical protein